MELKGIDKLTQTVSDIIEYIIGMEDVGVSLGTDFGAFCESNDIEYAIITIKAQNDQFDECAKENFGFLVQDDIDEWIIALLHELGHLQTWDSIPTSVKTSDSIKKFFIGKLSHFPNISKKYYNLPTEYYATEWACKWARKHHIKYNRIRNAIEPALKEFYTINDVVDTSLTL